MGNCIAFSEIDRELSSIPDCAGCLADTSFLIAVADKENHFHQDCIFLQDKFADYGVKIFASVTARTEFIDYHRRVIITETLMDMLAPTSRWRISSAVREILRSQKGWIDNQARSDSDPYLTDSRIKKTKQAFLPKTQSGHIGWTELCQEYLSGRLLSAWTGIAESLSLNYIDMGSEDIQTLFRKELKWEKNVFTL